jgi:GTP-binding protein
MKIKKAEFIKGAVRPADYPKSVQPGAQGLPQVAFAGRSNVGKSSLINRLVGRKGLAKTSSTPGRTREINFFTVNDRLIFVDLPGYGYAKVSKAMRQKWGPMVENYLTENPLLKLVILILDIRRDPGEEEYTFLRWLSDREIAYLVVVTKVDKEKKGKIPRRIEAVARQIGVKTEDIVPFSAVSGLGKDKIWSTILESIRV